jgi:glycosyltransferase involved in cell wall biosynthesis
MISVIIPAYNAERFLQETVETVFAQTYTDWEAIIIDDGSTDKTAKVARVLADRDSRVRLISVQNGGVSAARNKGLESVSPEAEFIAFLDADDLWEPDTLDSLLKALLQDPAAVGAHGATRCINGNGSLIRKGEMEAHTRERRAVVGKRVVKWPATRPTTFAVEAVENYLFIGAVLFKKSAYELAGPFQVGLTSLEDWDFWLRLTRHGHIVYVDQVVLSYRRHDANASDNLEKMSDGFYTVVKKTLDWPENTPGQRKLLEIAHKYHYTQLIRKRLAWARYAMKSGKLVQAAKQIRHALHTSLERARVVADLKAGQSPQKPKDS